MPAASARCATSISSSTSLQLVAPRRAEGVLEDRICSSPSRSRHSFGSTGKEPELCALFDVAPCRRRSAQSIGSGTAGGESLHEQDEEADGRSLLGLGPPVAVTHVLGDGFVELLLDRAGTVGHDPQPRRAWLKEGTALRRWLCASRMRTTSGATFWRLSGRPCAKRSSSSPSSRAKLSDLPECGVAESSSRCGVDRGQLNGEVMASDVLGADPPTWCASSMMTRSHPAATTALKRSLVVRVDAFGVQPARTRIGLMASSEQTI